MTAGDAPNDGDSDGVGTSAAIDQPTNATVILSDPTDWNIDRPIAATDLGTFHKGAKCSPAVFHSPKGLFDSFGCDVHSAS
jgi:hypothetical protein